MSNQINLSGSNQTNSFLLKRKEPSSTQEKEEAIAEVASSKMLKVDLTSSISFQSPHTSDLDFEKREYQFPIGNQVQAEDWKKKKQYLHLYIKGFPDKFQNKSLPKRLLEKLNTQLTRLIKINQFEVQEAQDDSIHQLTFSASLEEWIVLVNTIIREFEFLKNEEEIAFVDFKSIIQFLSFFDADLNNLQELSTQNNNNNSNLYTPEEVLQQFDSLNKILAECRLSFPRSSPSNSNGNVVAHPIQPQSIAPSSFSSNQNVCTGSFKNYYFSEFNLKSWLENQKDSKKNNQFLRDLAQQVFSLLEFEMKHTDRKSEYFHIKIKTPLHFFEKRLLMVLEVLRSFPKRQYLKDAEKGYTILLKEVRKLIQADPSFHTRVPEQAMLSLTPENRSISEIVKPSHFRSNRQFRFSSEKDFSRWDQVVMRLAILASEFNTATFAIHAAISLDDVKDVIHLIEGEEAKTFDLTIKSSLNDLKGMIQTAQTKLQAISHLSYRGLGNLTYFAQSVLNNLLELVKELPDET